MFLTEVNSLRLTFTATSLPMSRRKFDLLHHMAVQANKLFNVALWTSRHAWQASGVIPHAFELYHLVKSDLHWPRLPSGTAMAVLEEVWRAYRGWFGQRKTNPAARPPRYAKKNSPRTLTFKKQAFRLAGSILRLSLGREWRAAHGRYLFVPLRLPPTYHPEQVLEIDLVRVRVVGRRVEVQLVCTVRPAKPVPAGGVMAVDLGMKHLFATVDTDGLAALWSGGKLASVRDYWRRKRSRIVATEAARAKAQEGRETSGHRCPASRRAAVKESRQVKDILHVYTTGLIEDARRRGVGTILVGDLHHLRQDEDGRPRDWGVDGNRRLHAWPYAEALRMLTYKAERTGIGVVRVSERYSSQTCARCGARRKGNRVHRGLYRCRACGFEAQADLNGALNILQWHLQDREPHPLHLPRASDGVLAAPGRPAVSRFVFGTGLRTIARPQVA